ncbi:MAG: anti-sigma factor family protein [Phenylobacterium sp.]|uniref:anti-sigma factor family protein n=1 Tax=Phenylobacterium sp. TaxID=1871053 RepID=UPI00391BBDCD
MTDEATILAYVDGELDAAQAEAFETAMAADPDLAERVARHAELRQAVGGAFAEVLKEPVPERLAEAATAAVVVRPHFGRLGAWGPPQWAAMAACLVAGVFVGRLLIEPSPFASRGGELLAQGALAGALESQLAAEPGPIRIGLSFRDRQGAYCRTFAIEKDALAGLACKDGGGWAVRIAAAYQAQSGEYRMAASAAPPAVLAAVDDAIAGEPLDGEAEAAARATGWR